MDSRKTALAEICVDGNGRVSTNSGSDLIGSTADHVASRVPICHEQQINIKLISSTSNHIFVTILWYVQMSQLLGAFDF